MKYPDIYHVLRYSQKWLLYYLKAILPSPIPWLFNFFCFVRDPTEKNNNNKTRPNLSLNLCGIYISQKWPEPNSWVNQGQHKKWLLKTLLIWWIKITISLPRILYSLLILFSGDAGCGCQWRLARYSHQYLQPGADDCPGPLAAWLLITDAATYRTTRPLSVQVKKYFNTGTANMCEKSILASSSRLLICLVVPPGCV